MKVAIFWNFFSLVTFTIPVPVGSVFGGFSKILHSSTQDYMLHNFVAHLFQNEKLHRDDFCIKMKNSIFLGASTKIWLHLSPENFFSFVSGKDAFRSFW